MNSRMRTDREAGEASPHGVVADGVERSPQGEVRRSQDRREDGRQDELEPQLAGKPQHRALTEGEEPLGIAGDGAGLTDPLGQAPVERQRRQRHDQRRNVDPHDEQPVEQPSQRTDHQGDGDGEFQRQAESLPADPQHDGGEAEDRADREVDAGGDDDEGHGQRHQPGFGQQPPLIEQVLGAEEVFVELRQHRHHQHEDQEQHPLLAEEDGSESASDGGGGARAWFDACHRWALPG